MFLLKLIELLFPGTKPGRALEASRAPFMTFHTVCLGPDGSVKWTDAASNLVTTEGKNDILTKYFKGSSYTASWFMLLKGTGTPAAGDTLASHSTWAELTPYSGNRPAITFGTASGGSLSATAVSFSITGTATVSGFGVASVATGTSGILYNAVNFTGGDRAVQNGDTLNVTPTLTMT